MKNISKVCSLTRNYLLFLVVFSLTLLVLGLILLLLVKLRGFYVFLVKQINNKSRNNQTSLIPVWFDEQEATIHLPSSVFASEFEEDVGLLNKAAPVSGNSLKIDQIML